MKKEKVPETFIEIHSAVLELFLDIQRDSKKQSVMLQYRLSIGNFGIKLLAQFFFN